MPRTSEISNSDDIIDSRDVIARIAELESERDSFQESWAEERMSSDDGGTEPSEDEKKQAWEETEPSMADELNTLLVLASNGEGYGDWEHGAGLIRDSYFETYAQELAEDIGAIKGDAGWPLRHIDWSAAADELKQDYTSLDFDGVEYWMRA